MRSVILGTLFALTPTAVTGQVDARPGPHEAQVRLESKRVFGPKYKSNQELLSSRPKPPAPICRVDAEMGRYGCRVFRPADEDDAELNEGDILRAVREIGLPRLKAQVQPGTSTLVNVPTIFYTEPEAFNRTVVLLGFDIDLTATPVRYRWLHGDGTAKTTAKPGKPYPSTQVTHRYRQPAKVINPRVDVTYRVRYRVDGGAWNTIDQTLLASGPPTALEVKEAAPILTHP